MIIVENITKVLIFFFFVVEYFDGNHCQICHSKCESCNGPNITDCLSCSSSLLLQDTKCVNACDDGYFIDAGSCARCLHTCTNCVSRTNCTSCNKNLHLQSGECRSSCAEGYYSNRGVCTKCYLSCHTCNGPRRDQCVECPNGWQLAGGECHPECPQDYFKTDYGCQKCHHYCKTCEGPGPLACTSCPTHFTLVDGLCMECLGSQYYDATTLTCKTCHDSCRTCGGDGRFSCLTCALPLHFDKLNSQCVPCCPNDVTPDQLNSCCECGDKDSENGGCVNSTPADKRRIDGVAVLMTEHSTEMMIIGGGVNDEVHVESDSNFGHHLFSFTTFSGYMLAACLLVVIVYTIGLIFYRVSKFLLLF